MIKTVGPLCVIAAVAIVCKIHVALASRNLKILHAGTSDPSRQIQRRKLELNAKYFFIVLIFLELTLPTTSTTIFASFVCEEFDDGSYLQEQLTISCETADFQWWNTYAYCFMLVYPLGHVTSRELCLLVYG